MGSVVSMTEDECEVEMSSLINASLVKIKWKSNLGLKHFINDLSVQLVNSWHIQNFTNL